MSRETVPPPQEAVPEEPVPGPHEVMLQGVMPQEAVLHVLEELSAHKELVLEAELLDILQTDMYPWSTAQQSQYCETWEMSSSAVVENVLGSAHDNEVQPQLSSMKLRRPRPSTIKRPSFACILDTLKGTTAQEMLMSLSDEQSQRSYPINNCENNSSSCGSGAMNGRIISDLPRHQVLAPESIPSTLFPHDCGLSSFDVMEMRHQQLGESEQHLDMASEITQPKYTPTTIDVGDLFTIREEDPYNTSHARLLAIPKEKHSKHLKQRKQQRPKQPMLNTPQKRECCENKMQDQNLQQQALYSPASATTLAAAREGDSDSENAARRKHNAEMARRTRQRRKQHYQDLEKQVRMLKATNDMLAKELQSARAQLAAQGIANNQGLAAWPLLAAEAAGVHKRFRCMSSVCDMPRSS